MHDGRRVAFRGTADHDIIMGTCQHFHDSFSPLVHSIVAIFVKVLLLKWLAAIIARRRSARRHDCADMMVIFGLREEHDAMVVGISVARSSRSGD